MAHAQFTNDVWLKEWEESNTPKWAMKGLNPNLEKYKDDLTRGLECAKIFFPMCGDVADMNWLAELGHDVVGVELSGKAIIQFFVENQVEYDVKPCDSIKGDLYTSKKGNIRIYCGDFFLFSSTLENEFDGIWDRGSFNTLKDQDLRKSYVGILKSVMKPDCRIILELVIMEKVENSGTIKELFGNNYEVSDLGLVNSYAPEYADFPILGFQFFLISKASKILSKNSD